MNNYTVRHAVYLTLIVGAGVILWMAFCFVLGLPFHPWSTAAIGVFVGTSLFVFAGLDPVGVRIINSLFNLLSFVFLIVVGLAAVFGAPGGPFPLWALIPLLALGGVLGAAMAFFGIRPFLRVLMGRLDRPENGLCDKVNADLESLDPQNLAEFLDRHPFSVIHLDAKWDGHRAVVQRRIAGLSQTVYEVTSFGYIDIDDHPDHARIIGLQNVPACSYYRGHELVVTVIGAQQDIERNLELLREGGTPSTVP